MKVHPANGIDNTRPAPVILDQPLGLDGIEAGLSERLTLLAGGPRADARHRSLRSAIDWSYNLLGPAEQALLRRVAVFASAFTVDDAAAVWIAYQVLRHQMQRARRRD